MSNNYPNIPDELLDDIFQLSNFKQENQGSPTNLDSFSNNTFNLLDNRDHQRQQRQQQQQQQQCFTANYDSSNTRNIQGSNQTTGSSSSLYPNFNSIPSIESTYTISDIGTVTPQSTTDKSNEQPSNGNMSIADDTEEKKRRNTQASARFRYKRRMKELELEDKFNEINNYIANLEVQIKTLEMENACLKKIILTDSSGDGESTGGRLSNYELLKSLKEQSTGTFTITKF